MSDDKTPKSLVKTPIGLSKKRSNLSLDKENFKPSKLRSELYEDLKKDEVPKEAYDHNFSHPIERGIGLVIDSAFIYALFKLAFLVTPLELKIMQLFLDRYHLQFMFPEITVFQVASGVNLFFFLFFMVVVPTTFFNASLGKKLTKQRVRGEGKFTLSLTQVFKRELIFKPLGVIFVVGLAMPFFDKRRQSFHDRMCKTIVVKD